jgi:hypothetical protein
MISLLIIGLLVASLVIAKKHQRLAAVMDLVVALLVLFFRVIPGTADFIDWILMIALFIGGVFLFFAKDLAVESGSPSPSVRS